MTRNIIEQRTEYFGADPREFFGTDVTVVGTSRGNQCVGMQIEANMDMSWNVLT